jgi:hypothetical protein
MRIFAKAFAVVFVPAFALSVFVMLRLEDLGKVDSLGLWYTIYSATVGALAIAVIFGGTFAAIFHQWRPPRE